MKKIIGLALLSLLSTRNVLHAQADRPQLVIGVVLDQMRWDYLYRYQDKFGSGGFKRLMNEGFNCQQTYVDYLPTYTAPGHACIYTGSVPALHGIAGNDWIDKSTMRSWYCTEDTTVTPIGGGKDGAMSPRNMNASTITDELRLATNFRSRTYGIAIKDRGAILPAGHSANGAFWLESATGNFISSSFYLSALPQWLIDFNKRNVVDSLLGLDWHPLYPISSYTESVPDDNTYEGTFKWETKPVFPHTISKAAGTNKGVIRSTPYGNTLTRLAAESLIRGEQLGKKGATDFLAVSFSSTDYIGHMYAPNSIEVEDMYYRMDKELELFLNFLDTTIGKGRYLLFLTADHAGAHNPTFLKDHHIPAGYIHDAELQRSLNDFLKKEYQEELVFSITNYQVYLDDKRIEAKKLDRNNVKSKIVQWLQVQPGIASVLDMERIDAASAVALIKERAINGYHVQRSGALQIINEPGWFSSTYKTGTTHGSWNPYDAHIPLIWYGWGVAKGKTSRTIHMTDIAPTLAALLKIQVPNTSIGQPIIEILD